MKEIKEQSIYLTGGSYYITENPNDVYHILEGSIFVYVVPYKKGRIGRRAYLYEAFSGELVPSLSYTDIEYHSWRFCFVASEQAKIQIISGGVTNPLKEKCALRAGVTNYAQEGFESGLVDKYRINLVKEDGFILRTEQEKIETVEKTSKLILNAFNIQSETNQIEENSNNALYNMVAKICKIQKIPIAPYETIKACCGDKITLQDIARLSHFPYREVVLEENWHKKDAGPLLVFVGEKEKPAACVTRGQHKYSIYIDETKRKVTKEISEQCNPKAFMIYRPFLQKKITTKDFTKYCIKGLKGRDIAIVVLLTIISSLIGLLLPQLNQMLYDTYIPTGNESVIMQIGFLITSFMIGNILFSVVKNIGTFRIRCHVQYCVQNATYHRMFEMPENFFRNYESADLSNRVMEIGNMAGEAVSIAFGAILTAISMLFYLWRMFSYSRNMTLVSILIFAIYGGILYFVSRARWKYQKMVIELDGENDSIMYQFLNGISKIRIAGVEDRAIYEYMKAFTKQRTVSIRLEKISAYSSAILAISSSLFTIIFYIILYKFNNISMGEYMGFNSAFGMVSSALNSLIEGMIGYKMLRPLYDRIRPMLETIPECGGEKNLPGEITGKIDIDHLDFSYGQKQNDIFNDLSLHIKSGEYVGIVGASGCGKSTLLKLLLGFEQPTAGKIFYDNQDMESLDLQELRKKFGVVLQDGKLIAGSIFENITITSPQATLEDVQRVVREVGLEQDIEEMPMGLHTVLSEDCGTISGGQQQRILIARALINRPKIIYFDEATSALDNITQATVCNTLKKIDSTRVVIAHRLSTIQECDRIIVFDHGNIVEEGNYQQLMENQGLFYQLASRQSI